MESFYFTDPIQRKPLLTKLDNKQKDDINTLGIISMCSANYCPSTIYIKLNNLESNGTDEFRFFKSGGLLGKSS